QDREQKRVAVFDHGVDTLAFVEDRLLDAIDRAPHGFGERDVSKCAAHFLERGAKLRVAPEVPVHRREVTTDRFARRAEVEPMLDVSAQDRTLLLVGQRATMALDLVRHHDALARARQLLTVRFVTSNFSATSRALSP